MMKPFRQQKRRTDYSSILGQQEFFVTPLLRDSIAEALSFIGPPIAGSLVLDVGAGESPLRPELEVAGYRYWSLDIQQNSLGSIDFVSQIDRQLPPDLYSIGGFDLLILTEVLEHVKCWSHAFRNVSALLKSGGHCIITTPFLYMLHEEPHDYWRATDHAIKAFADANELEIVLSRRNGDGWDVLGTLLCSSSVARKQKTFLAYLATAAVWCVHFLLRLFFKSKLLKHVVDFQMRFYLGNFFVLRKRPDICLDHISDSMDDYSKITQSPH